MTSTIRTRQYDHRLRGTEIAKRCLYVRDSFTSTEIALSR